MGGPMGGPMGPPMGGGYHQGWGGPGNQGYGYGPQGGNRVVSCGISVTLTSRSKGYQGWGPQGQWGGYGGGPGGNYGYGKNEKSLFLITKDDPLSKGPQGGPQQGYNSWNWGGPGPQGGKILLFC